MKAIYIFILFILIALVQIAVPAHMIWNNENAMSLGKVYRFKTQPIDPNDPFRGKYITLRYDMDSFKTSDSIYAHGDKLYVYVGNNDEGFAKATRISKEPLEINEDYVITKVTGNYHGEVTFELPFNRFYMEETKAPKAEKAYVQANRDSLVSNVYALVYIKDDIAVLKDVIINDIPIADYVNQ